MDNPLITSKRRSWRWIVPLIIVVAAIGFYATCGFYSVQPIGALPEGSTVIVWRNADEPFFNSADGLCIARTGGVSLLCRGMAFGQAPKDRILLRLPYMRWAYLRSTGGEEFDR